MKSWRDCSIVFSETTHSPGNYQRSSSLVSEGAGIKRFRIFEEPVPFSLVIKQSVQENTFRNISLFTGEPNSTLVVGHGKVPALRTKKQGVRRMPLKSHQPYGRWNRNQGALVPWVKHDEHSTEKDNLAKTRFQRNVCSLCKYYQTAGGNGTKKSKICLSETTSSGVCFCASTVLSLWSQLCSPARHLALWCPQLCFSFSTVPWRFGPFLVPYKFKDYWFQFFEKCPRYFDRDSIESVDCSG